MSQNSINQKPIKRVHILGDGVTARTVRENLERFGLEEVSLEKADVVVTSPGIPPRAFPKTTCPILSDIELAYRLMPRPRPFIIGVTGTNGKSTVTAMVAYLLDCPAAGNIGTPLIHYVGKPLNAIVVELSSYQLETCNTFKPNVAIFLNLTPDHLARHGTMAEYGRAKSAIFNRQTPSDRVIYNADDALVQDLVQSAASVKIGVKVSDAIVENLPKLKNPGNHQRFNAAVSLLAAECAGLPMKNGIEKIVKFHGLAHRLEPCGVLNGCCVYNDSKATNPDSVLIAMAAMTTPFHLILGGEDKGLDLDFFLTEVHRLAKTVVVYGEISDRLIAAARIVNPNWAVYQTETMQMALDWAVAQSIRGDSILFSPACSSFDQFKSFEDRGDQFKQYVNKQCLNEKYTKASDQ